MVDEQGGADDLVSRWAEISKPEAGDAPSHPTRSVLALRAAGDDRPQNRPRHGLRGRSPTRRWRHSRREGGEIYAGQLCLRLEQEVMRVSELREARRSLANMSLNVVPDLRVYQGMHESLGCGNRAHPERYQTMTALREAGQWAPEIARSEGSRRRSWHEHFERCSEQRLGHARDLCFATQKRQGALHLRLAESQRTEARTNLGKRLVPARGSLAHGLRFAGS